MKKIYLSAALTTILSACGGQTIVINEAPTAREKKPSTNNRVRQLQVVINKEQSCDTKLYKLINEELTSDSKICYYLTK